MDQNVYIHQEPDGLWTIRQRQYRDLLEAGTDHPHDVCAVAQTKENLRRATEKLWPSAWADEASGA